LHRPDRAEAAALAPPRPTDFARRVRSRKTVAREHERMSTRARNAPREAFALRTRATLSDLTPARDELPREYRRRARDRPRPFPTPTDSRERRRAEAVNCAGGGRRASRHCLAPGGGNQVRAEEAIAVDSSTWIPAASVTRSHARMVLPEVKRATPEQGTRLG